MNTPNFRTPNSRTEIIAQGEKIALLRETGAFPVLHDIKGNRLYDLNQPSFIVALGLLPVGKPIALKALYCAQEQIVGFSLYESAAFIGLFTTLPNQRPMIPIATRVLATPQGLHIRLKNHEDWQTILWHPHLR